MKITKHLCSLLTMFSFALFGFLLTAGVNLVRADGIKNYVVTFNERTSESVIQSVLQSENLQASKLFGDLAIAIVSTDDVQAVEDLEQNSNVEGVDLESTVSIPDLEVSSEQQSGTSFTDPIYLMSQWHIRRVRADQVWDDGYTGSHNTIVGIVDTGIASNHPDLGANIVYEKCFTGFQPTCTPYPDVPGGNHGTAMAGIIGSLINGVGVIGVAPNIGIANYDVAEIGPDGIPTVFDSSIWEAINDAADQRFDVLNFSFGEALQRPLSREDRRRVANWRRVVRRANARGVTMIAAAGNDGLDINDPELMYIPCELPHVICAGATNIRPQPVFPQTGFFDEATFYTNYGSNAVDIAAPGGDCGGPDFAICLTAPDPRYFVWTTNVLPSPACAATESCPVSYTASIGTSFSAPHTVGVAALAIDLYKARTGRDLRPNQVERILQLSAEPLPAIPELGAGMVNAQGAIQRVLNMTD